MNIGQLINRIMPAWLRKTLLKPTNYWIHDVQGVRRFIPDMRITLRNLQRFGYQPELVIDVGAHSGSWTEMAMNVWPDCSYILIDPLDDKCSLLEQKFKQESVKVVNALLSHEEGVEVTFFVMGTGSSIYQELRSAPQEVRRFRSRTLDGVMESLEATGRSTLLKLDVQGAELDILRGAEETLALVDFLILETSCIEMNEGAPEFAEVIGFCAERNFVLHDIMDLHRAEDARLNQVDLLFRRQAK